MDAGNFRSDTGESVAVPLSRGRVAYVSPEDAERVLALRWCCVGPQLRPGRQERVTCGPRRQRTVMLARFILDAPPGVHVDHRNGDFYDNRRENLRLCSPRENQRNRRRTWGTSRFKGVSLHRVTGRFRATIHDGAKRVALGSYKTEEAAARAYDEAALRLFGEFAATNAELFGLDAA